MTLDRDLLRPEAYPEKKPKSVALVHTHISWVFLLETDVFKVKRPVSLGFLDFASLDSRKAACDAEVRLNARLAPATYLGVVPIVQDAGGRHQIGGPGRVVDWAVHMRRLPDDRRADNMLARGEMTPQILDALAVRLAAFHAGAADAGENARFGSVQAVSRCVEDNFAETKDAIALYLDRREADDIMSSQRSFLRDHGPLFDQRIAAGRVRDGHGDLRLEHVYIAGEPSPTIIDCIEFDVRFRCADVCADIAFLTMDLAAHGRVDWAERLLARYAREANDFDLYELVDFYEGYRAYVRGKISSLVARDESMGWIAQKRAHDEARRYFMLALSSHRRSLLRPSVVAVGGVIASGKSTVAEAIGNRMSAPVVDADRTRKAMLGVAADHPVPDDAWQGAYDPRVTETVYEEVLRRAGVVLASGRPVVIDASFRSAAFRKAARALAMAHGAPFLFVECRVDPRIAKRRLVERSRAPSVSDGRVAIFDAFAAAFEPAAELSGRDHIVLDTGRDLDDTLTALGERLSTWPAGLTG